MISGEITSAQHINTNCKPTNCKLMGEPHHTFNTKHHMVLSSSRRAQVTKARLRLCQNAFFTAPQGPVARHAQAEAPAPAHAGRSLPRLLTANTTGRAEIWLKPHHEASVHCRAAPSSETPSCAPVCNRKRALDQPSNHGAAERQLLAVPPGPAPQTLAPLREAQANTRERREPGDIPLGAVPQPLSDPAVVVQYEQGNARSPDTRRTARKLGTGEKLLNPKDSLDPCALSSPTRDGTDQVHVQARAAADKPQGKGEWRTRAQRKPFRSHKLQEQIAGAAIESCSGKSSPAGMVQHPKIATPGYRTPSLHRIPAPGIPTLLPSQAGLPAAAWTPRGPASIAVPQSGIPTGYPSSTFPDHAGKGLGGNPDPGRRRQPLHLLHRPPAVQKPAGDLLEQIPTARDLHRNPLPQEDGSVEDNTSQGLETSTGAAIVSEPHDPMGGDPSEGQGPQVPSGGRQAVVPQHREAAAMRDERQGRQPQALQLGRNVDAGRRPVLQELTLTMNGGNRPAGMAPAQGGRRTGGSSSPIGRGKSRFGSRKGYLGGGQGLSRKPRGDQMTTAPWRAAANRSTLSRRSTGAPAVPCVNSVSDECSPGPLLLLPSSATPAQDELPQSDHHPNSGGGPLPSMPAAVTCSPDSLPTQPDLPARPWPLTTENAVDTHETEDQGGDPLCKTADVPALPDSGKITGHHGGKASLCALQKRSPLEESQECLLSGGSKKIAGMAPGRALESNPKPLDCQHASPNVPHHLQSGHVGQLACTHGEEEQGRPSAGAGQGTSNHPLSSDPARGAMAAALSYAFQNASASDPLHMSTAGRGEATFEYSVEMVPDTLLPLSQALLMGYGDTRDLQSPGHAPKAPSLTCTAAQAWRDSPLSGSAGGIIGSQTAPNDVLLPNQAHSQMAPDQGVRRANSPGHRAVRGGTHAVEGKDQGLPDQAGAVSPSDPDVAVPDTPISSRAKQARARAERTAASVSKGPGPSAADENRRAVPPSPPNSPADIDLHTLHRQRGDHVHPPAGAGGKADGSTSSLSTRRPRSELAPPERNLQESPAGHLMIEPQALAEPSMGEAMSLEETCGGGNRQGVAGSLRGGSGRLEGSSGNRGMCGAGAAGPGDAATQGDCTLPELGTYLDVVPATPADVADGLQGDVGPSHGAPDAGAVRHGCASFPAGAAPGPSQGACAELAAGPVLPVALVEAVQGESPEEKASLHVSNGPRPSSGSRRLEFQAADWGSGSGSGGEDCKGSSPAAANAFADSHSDLDPELSRRADACAGAPGASPDGAPCSRAGDQICEGGTQEGEAAAGTRTDGEAEPEGTPGTDKDRASAGDSLPSGASGILSSVPRDGGAPYGCPVPPAGPAVHDVQPVPDIRGADMEGAPPGAQDVQPLTTGPMQEVPLNVHCVPPDRLRCVPPWVPQVQHPEPEVPRQETGPLPCGSTLPRLEAPQLGQAPGSTDPGGGAAAGGVPTAVQTEQGVLRDEQGTPSAMGGSPPTAGVLQPGPIAACPPARDQETWGRVPRNAVSLGAEGTQALHLGTGVFGPSHACDSDNAGGLPCLPEEALVPDTLLFPSPVSALAMSSSGRFAHATLVTCRSGFGCSRWLVALGKMVIAPPGSRWARAETRQRRGWVGLGRGKHHV